MRRLSMMRVRHAGPPAPRWLWVVPMAFALLVTATVALAALAAARGSVHVPPGEGVTGAALVGACLYALAVEYALRRAGLSGSGMPVRIRLGIVVALGALALALGHGILAPAMNGTVAISAERHERLTLVALQEPSEPVEVVVVVRAA